MWNMLGNNSSLSIHIWLQIFKCIDYLHARDDSCPWRSLRLNQALRPPLLLSPQAPHSSSTEKRCFLPTLGSGPGSLLSASPCKRLCLPPLPSLLLCPSIHLPHPSVFLPSAPSVPSFSLLLFSSLPFLLSCSPLLFSTPPPALPHPLFLSPSQFLSSTLTPGLQTARTLKQRNVTSLKLYYLWWKIFIFSFFFSVSRLFILHSCFSFKRASQHHFISLVLKKSVDSISSYCLILHLKICLMVIFLCT